ncbi:MAG: 4-hydroxythreonine-4-phosphate dehydrogenase PdxA [Endomicrobiaceae bacterium]|nr:4-hydroxythreonine-4-phosphate dehydrogenase PdxA [Endomicrobiaceae bacterium]
MLKPKVAITIGDPAGIGPEIVFKAVNSLKVQRVCSPVVVGDKTIISEYFNINKKYKNIEFIFSSDYNKNVFLGKPSKISGLIACDAIKTSVKMCLDKKTKSMVTAPVSKESFKYAGLKYSGHTEFLGALTKTKNYCMMMICDNINSVMVTRHLPVSKISSSLTQKDIVLTVKLSADFIKKIVRRNPKILLCALNPHAGDNGILGNDEKVNIIPAMKKLKKQGYDICGIFPVDVAWAKFLKYKYDLIVGMYHDQIMLPLKILNPKKIVNVTAGLPFIRTSPGHGTAFDIAGKNVADPSSMEQAILYAAGKQ